MKGKIFSVFLLIASFLVFLAFETKKNTEFSILKINAPNDIVVDLNSNGKEDDAEEILLDFETFSTKPSEEQTDLAKTLKISKEDALGLGFLSMNLAKDTLENKKISLKNSKIYVNNKDYEKIIYNEGFAIKKGKLEDKKFKQNLEKVRKLNLRIFNNKSFKYHKLDCKYGLLAHNSQIIPLSQIPKDAKPCKFCHLKNKKNKHFYKKGKKDYDINFNDTIPDIAQPPLIFSKNNIKIFLTDFTRILKPTNNCETTLCKELVKEIDLSKDSIDFAIYGYTKIPKIQKALQNAQTRGVKIRFVYDSDLKNSNIYPDTSYLSNILLQNNHDLTNAIMHDKFFIFDNKKVLTGSANISATDMSGFNSNIVIFIDSKDIAQIYSQEFEQMYLGKFHNKKKKIKKEEFDSENFIVYFSPKEKAIEKEVIPLIENSKKYIYMPAFLITRKDLNESLIKAHSRGVSIKILLDATNTHTPASKIKQLRNAGIQVKTEIFAGKLHSKSIIIDDEYTIAGSMNFSKSGENANDENMVIIKDKDIAIFYKNFFLYLWKRTPDKWLKYNARAEAPESIGSCSDGIDNDFDGKIDKNDDSCKPTLHKKTLAKIK